MAWSATHPSGTSRVVVVFIVVTIIRGAGKELLGAHVLPRISIAIVITFIIIIVVSIVSIIIDIITHSIISHHQHSHGHHDHHQHSQVQLDSRAKH